MSNWWACEEGFQFMVYRTRVVIPRVFSFATSDSTVDLFGLLGSCFFALGEVSPRFFRIPIYMNCPFLHHH